MGKRANIKATARNTAAIAAYTRAMAIQSGAISPNDRQVRQGGFIYWFATVLGVTVALIVGIMQLLWRFGVQIMRHHRQRSALPQSTTPTRALPAPQTGAVGVQANIYIDTSLDVHGDDVLPARYCSACGIPLAMSGDECPFCGGTG